MCTFSGDAIAHSSKVPCLNCLFLKQRVLVMLGEGNIEPSSAVQRAEVKKPQSQSTA